MQHAEKEKKKKKTKQTFSQISPHKLKRTRDPQKKKHLQTKAWPELHREQRARTAFNQILIYKRKKNKKHIKISPLSCVQCVAV